MYDSACSWVLSIIRRGGRSIAIMHNDGRCIGLAVIVVVFVFSMAQLLFAIVFDAMTLAVVGMAVFPCVVLNDVFIVFVVNVNVIDIISVV